MTIAGISVIGLALLIGGVYILKRYAGQGSDNPDRAKKIVMVMWFFAGLGMTGGIVSALAGMFGTGGKAVGGLFSVGPTVVLTIFGLLAIADLYWALHPRHGGNPQKLHPALALITPILLGVGALHPIVFQLGLWLNGTSAPLTHLMGA